MNSELTEAGLGAICSFMPETTGLMYCSLYPKRGDPTKEGNFKKDISKECLKIHVTMLWASQVALVVKNLPASARDIREAGSKPGAEDPLEEVMATHSNSLA